MKYIFIFILSLALSVMAKADMMWAVGSAEVEGKPVVYKFINAIPDESVRHKMSWLTVVSWRYDGSSRNGMPSKEVNEKMIRLEDGLDEIDGKAVIYLDAYSATGNNLKEFVFYVADRVRFMENFNKALKTHPVYPIEVNFYEDREWGDVVKIQKMFGVSR